eukprot:1000403_1
MGKEVVIEGNEQKKQHDRKALKLCNSCKKPTRKHCNRCKTVYYCDQKCQKSDWKNHKSSCKKPRKEAESVWKLVDKFSEKYSRSKYPQISEATVSAFKVLSSAVSGGGHQQNADAISNWRHRIVTTVSQLQKRCREEKNVDFMNETAGLMRDFVKIQNVSIAAAYVNDVPTDSHLSLLD